MKRMSGLWKQTLKHVRQSKCNYILGCVTIVVVVLTAAIAQIMLEAAPLLFLQQAERSQGQVDLVLKPDTALMDTFPFLNYTSMEIPYSSYHVEIPLMAVTTDQGNALDAVLVGIDQHKEESMGLGVGWDTSLLHNNHVAVSRAIQTQYGLAVGDSFHIHLDVNAYQGPLFANILAQCGITDTERIRCETAHALAPIELHVVHILSPEDGKGLQSKGIVVDVHALPHLLANATDSKFRYRSCVREARLQELASCVVVNIAPKKRLETYKHTHFENVQEALVRFGDNVVSSVGALQVHAALPLLEKLSDTKMMSLYLGMIVSMILIIMSLLASMLIYSLMIISIEGRTFEIAVFRMIGMDKRYVLKLLVCQALAYAIPSITLALVLAEVAMASITFPVPVDHNISAGAGVLGAGLGLLIPMLSSFLPIRAALGRNLQQSLDVHRPKNDAVDYSIERADATFDSTTQTSVAVGIGCTIMGFIVYYVVPYALVTMNLVLFFNVFLFVILGMLAGALMLALNIAVPLQRTLALFYFPRSMSRIIRKNFTAHRNRNSKTTIMFSLAIGFVVFVQVMYNMEILASEYQLKQTSGAPMAALAFFNRTMQQNCDAFLAEADVAPHVTAAWISQVIPQARISSLGHVFRSEVSVHAVTPSFFDVTYSSFLRVSEKSEALQHTHGISLSEALYTTHGVQSIIAGSSALASVTVDSIEEDVLIDMTESTMRPWRKRTKVIASLDAAASLTVSKNEGQKQDVIVSLPTWAYLAGIASIEEIPMRKLMLRFKDTADDAFKTRVKQRLEHITESEVWDERSFSSSLMQTKAVLDMIFSTATYIALLLCMFSLMASMWTNITEQSKEIAILRSLGTTNVRVWLIYTLEAFTLVIVAGGLGIGCGTLIGWALMQQRAATGNFPLLVPPIPTQIVFAVLGASVVCSIVAVTAPCVRLARMSVSDVIRL